MWHLLSLEQSGDQYVKGWGEKIGPNTIRFAQVFCFFVWTSLNIKLTTWRQSVMIFLKGNLFVSCLKCLENVWKPWLIYFFCLCMNPTNTTLNRKECGLALSCWINPWTSLKKMPGSQHVFLENLWWIFLQYCYHLILSERMALDSLLVIVVMMQHHFLSLFFLSCSDNSTYSCSKTQSKQIIFLLPN